MYAYECCRRGVAWKESVQRFNAHSPTRCLRLLRQLEAGTYRPGKSYKFKIMDRGKLREINSIGIDDRVVQRCLCDWALAPVIKSRIVEGNSACLKGRGLTHAVDRVREMLTRATSRSWVMLADFHNYFRSIDQKRLLDLLHGLFDERLFQVVESVIEGNSVGLELGSHVSQLCAVFFPNELDHLLTEWEGCIGYERYMDDLVCVCKDRESAEIALETLSLYAQHMGLVLNERKTHIQPATHPFVFCKRRFVKERGGVGVYIRKTQTRHIRKRAARIRRSKLPIETEPIKAANLGQVRQGDADLDWFIDYVWKENDGKTLGSHLADQLSLLVPLGDDDGKADRSRPEPKGHGDA